MVDTAPSLLILSVVAQGIAAVLALRLNWLYGQRWAWTLIAVGIALMTLRRALTLFRVIVLDDYSTTIDDEHGDEAFTALSASVSLLVSLLILAGVASIGPIFRKIARAEKILTDERDGLRQVVSARDAEFMVARRIQQTLFPADALRTRNIEVAGGSRPAAETGGDYFDYFLRPDGGLLVVIGDVSGHGLGPSLVMAEVRAWVRAALAEWEPDPGRLLTRLNALLTNDAASYFVTMFLVSITPDGRQLSYASAGHPAYLLDGGDTQTLAAGGLPLGVMATSRYESSPAIGLHTGELLLLATDGLFEAVSAGHEPFGVERALDIIREHSGRPASELVEAVHERVRRFTEGRPHDDVTMVVVTFPRDTP